MSLVWAKLSAGAACKQVRVTMIVLLCVLLWVLPVELALVLLVLA